MTDSFHALSVRSRRPLLIFAIVMSIVVACLLLILASRGPPEPTYKGLTMVQWVLAGPTPFQQEAIVILGTNNLQLLVRRLQHDPTKDRVFVLYSRLPARLQSVKFLQALCAKKFWKARYAEVVLHRLGPRAAPAVPELAELARGTGQPVASPALGVLHDIGEPGIPGLVAGMSNTNQSVRLTALFYLGKHRNFPAAWHAITNAFADPDPKVRDAADIASRTNDEAK